MPTRWLILAIVLFFAIMFAVKTAAAYAVNTWGAWVIVPVVLVLLPIYLLIDRHDKKKFERLND
jgi:O-antigen/teichoic acid export membrane protein